MRDKGEWVQEAQDRIHAIAVKHSVNLREDIGRDMALYLYEEFGGYIKRDEGDFSFVYAVRAALGMNDKCGLTGLEKDVAEVHGIATNLRDVLTAVLPLLENCNGSRSWGIEADRLTKRVRAALADAQFPRLWG